MLGIQEVGHVDYADSELPAVLDGLEGPVVATVSMIAVKTPRAPGPMADSARPDLKPAAYAIPTRLLWPSSSAISLVDAVTAPALGVEASRRM
jgi:hypothetical protein